MSIEILTREYTIVSCTVLKLAAPAPGAAHLNQHQELLLSCLRVCIYVHICALHLENYIPSPCLCYGSKTLLTAVFLTNNLQPSEKIVKKSIKLFTFPDIFLLPEKYILFQLPSHCARRDLLQTGTSKGSILLLRVLAVSFYEAVLTTNT